MREALTDVHIYLPESLARKLAKLAETECRSLSAQAVYLLQKAIKESSTEAR